MEEVFLLGFKDYQVIKEPVARTGGRDAKVVPEFKELMQ